MHISLLLERHTYCFCFCIVIICVSCVVFCCFPNCTKNPPNCGTETKVLKVLDCACCVWLTLSGKWSLTVPFVPSLLCHTQEPRIDKKKISEKCHLLLCQSLRFMAKPTHIYSPAVGLGVGDYSLVYHFFIFNPQAWQHNKSEQPRTLSSCSYLLWNKVTGCLTRKIEAILVCVLVSLCMCACLMLFF